MSTIGGNNSIQDGLIFHYDTGNKLKSFKGEPTTNLVNNSLNYSSGWIHDNITINSSDGGFFQISETTATSAAHILGQQFITEATTYTQSCIVKKRGRRYIGMAFSSYTSWTGGSGGHTFFDLDEGIVHSFTGAVGPLNSGIERINGDTFKIWITATCSSAGVSSRINVMLYQDSSFTSYTGNPSFGLFVKNIQLEKKTYPTPFTPSSRSTIESLIDLKGNQIIDVSTLSFETNEIKFSNTSILNIGTDNKFNFVGPFTCEVMCNPTNIGWRRLVMHANHDHWQLDFSNLKEFRFDVYSTGGGIHRPMSSPVELNENYHVVGVCDGIYVILYLNGIEVSRKTLTSNIISKPNTNLAIGHDNSSTTGVARWNGEIPIVKIYSRALSPDEVKLNFNSVKSRFNIT